MSDPTNPNLAVVAATYYPDLNDPAQAARFGEAQKLAANSQERDIPFYPVDGTPGDQVREGLEEFGAQVVEPEKNGLFYQQRTGILTAFENGADLVLVTEPEKPDLVRHASQIAEAASASNLTLVGYDETGRATLPPYQRHLEEIGGHTFQRELGMPISDNWRGPRVYDAHAAVEFADFDPTSYSKDMQWLHLWAVSIRAAKAGMKVNGVEVPSMHPGVVTDLETNNQAFDTKRETQFDMQMGPGLRALKELYVGGAIGRTIIDLGARNQ